MDIDTLRSFLLGDGGAILAFARNGWGLAVGGAVAVAVGFLRASQHEDLLRRPWMGLGTLVLACLHAALLATALWGMSRWAGGDVAWLLYFQPLLAILALLSMAHLLEVVPWSALGEETGSRIGSAAALLAILAQLKLAMRTCTVLTGGETDKPATALVCGVLAIEFFALGALWLRASDFTDRLSGFLFGPRADGCGFCCLQCFLVIGGGVGLFMGGLSGLNELAHAPWLVTEWGLLDPPSQGVLGGVVGLAALALAVALHSRPRVLRMRRFESLVAAGDTVAALVEVSAHEPRHYPAHWTPAIDDPGAMHVFLEEVVAGRVAHWVAAAILDSRDLVRHVRLSLEMEEDEPVLGPHTARMIELLQQAEAGGHDTCPIFDELETLRQAFCVRLAQDAVPESMQTQASGLGLEVLTGEELEETLGKDVPDVLRYMGMQERDGEQRLRLLVWFDRNPEEDEDDEDDEEDSPAKVQAIMARALATDCVELWIVSPRIRSIHVLERAGDSWTAHTQEDPHRSRLIPGLTLNRQALWTHVDTTLDHRFPWPAPS